MQGDRGLNGSAGPPGSQGEFGVMGEIGERGVRGYEGEPVRNECRPRVENLTEFYLEVNRQPLNGQKL